MATVLVCHGAWSAGWAWGKVRPLLAGLGHTVFTPTYTGLGERAHLASPMVDLELHIRDVLAVIEYENLSDIVLVGHSYGGMVATGVADRVAGLVRRVVYLDAFVPGDGQSLNDLTLGAPMGVDGWLVPPHAPPPDTSAADVAWTASRRRHHPEKCFSQKLALSGAVARLPRSYIHCTRKPGHDSFAQFAARFAGAAAWDFYARDWSHSPNITAPEALSSLLDEIAQT